MSQQRSGHSEIPLAKSLPVPISLSGSVKMSTDSRIHVRIPTVRLPSVSVKGCEHFFLTTRPQIITPHHIRGGRWSVRLKVEKKDLRRLMKPPTQRGCCWESFSVTGSAMEFRMRRSKRNSRKCSVDRGREPLARAGTVASRPSGRAPISNMILWSRTSLAVSSARRSCHAFCAEGPTPQGGQGFWFICPLLLRAEPFYVTRDNAAIPAIPALTKGAGMDRPRP